MSKKIVIQRMGQTMKEGTVVRWLKQEGDRIKTGDKIYELEYDKATVEVESPADGVLHIIVDEGETLPVGAKVGEILGEGESLSEAPTPSNVETVLQNAAAADEKSVYGISASAKRMIRQNSLCAADIVPANGKRVMPSDIEAFLASNGAKTGVTKPIKASPLATKVAEKIGVDLSSVSSHGRVLAQDIMSYVQSHQAASADRGETVLPMSGMRRAIARNMQESHMTSPTVTYHTSVDMSEMKQYRDQLKRQNIKVSYTDLLVKFVAKALLEYPLLNCTLANDKILCRNYVNMGVAVALDSGLVVPNVPDADRKSLQTISTEIKALAAAAREGSLSADRMKGGTFTITNLGMYGIEEFSPIINQPEVAILGVNAMIDTPVVRDGQMVIRPLMKLSLTADHRVVDGAVAAQFLQRVRNLMENPALMLA